MTSNPSQTSIALVTSALGHVQADGKVDAEAYIADARVLLEGVSVRDLLAVVMDLGMLARVLLEELAEERGQVPEELLRELARITAQE